MSDAPIEFVKVYDFETKATTVIPAAELHAGMVRVRLEGSDEIVWADSSQLKMGELRHPPFTGAVREMVLYIEQSLADVFPQTYERWEDGFRRDLHVEQEIALWLNLCRCLDSFSAKHDLTSEERQEAFAILVVCMNGTPSTALEAASVHLLDRETAQSLVDEYFSGGGNQA